MDNDFMVSLYTDEKKERIYKNALIIDEYVKAHPKATIMDLKRDLKNIPIKDLNYLIQDGRYALIAKQGVEESMKIERGIRGTIGVARPNRNDSKLVDDLREKYGLNTNKDER